MKKSTLRLIAASLCASMIGIAAGAGVYAYAGKSETPVATENSVESESADKSIKAGAVIEKEDPANDETVYVLAGADGQQNRLIVSSKVKKADGTEYSMNDAQGDLPVDMKISYKLDGKDIEADKLAGVSGHIVISYEFTNRQFEEVKLGDKTERIYVPFAMITGMLLDNEKFSNITVSSGKAVDDGNKTVVVGIAFPGLSDSLAIDKETFDIPSGFEIEADVKDFELGNTYTISTNELFNRINTEKLEDADDLKDSITDLTDAMDKLMEGSVELKNGLGELLDSTGTLTAAVAQINGGAGQLADGTRDLKAGADRLAGGLSDLADGAKQVDAGAAAVKAGIGTLSEGAAQVSGGAAQVSDGLATLSQNSSALDAGAETVFASLLATADQSLQAAGLQLPSLTIDNYQAVLGPVVEQTQGTAAGKQLAGLKASLDSYNQFYQGLLSYTNGVDTLAAGAAKVSTGAAQVAGGAGDLAAGAEQLKAGTEALYSGIGQIGANAPALIDGIDQLYTGAVKLHAGTDELHSKLPELTDGVERLHEGAGKLADGIKKLNDEGIEKLVNLFGDNIEELGERMRALKDASSHYCSFTDINNKDSQVRFIYKTDAIE